MSGDGTAPAGWYPMQDGSQRYWDGQQWTEHVTEPPTPAPPPTPGPSGAPAPSPFFQPDSGQASDQPPGQGGPFERAPFVQQPLGHNQPQTPYADGRLAMATTADDRNMATLAHVLGLVTGFLGPLIMWIIKKDQSPFAADQAREALNFQLSMMLYWLIAFVSLIVLIGIVLFPILLLMAFILPIVAAVESNKGVAFRYPLTIRFLS